MTSGCPTNEQLMPCLASFFDAMSGVKKLTNFEAVITCTTLAFEASDMAYTSAFNSSSVNPFRYESQATNKKTLVIFNNKIQEVYPPCHFLFNTYYIT